MAIRLARSLSSLGHRPQWPSQKRRLWLRRAINLSAKENAQAKGSERRVEVGCLTAGKEALSVNHHPLQPDRLGLQAIVQALPRLMKFNRYLHPRRPRYWPIRPLPRLGRRT